MKKYIEKIKVIGIVCIFCILMTVSKVGCPIRFVTGVSCAGCGMTRAWQHALQGDFKGAINYHPLFWIVPFLAIFWFFCDESLAKWVKVIWVVLLMLFTVVYIMRLINPADTIVTVDFSNSILYKLLVKGEY